MKVLNCSTLLAFCWISIANASYVNNPNRDSVDCSRNTQNKTPAEVMESIKSMSMDEKILLAFAKGKGEGNSSETDFNGCIENVDKISSLEAIRKLDIRDQFLKLSSKVNSIFPSISLVDIAKRTDYCETISTARTIIGTNTKSSTQSFVWRPGTTTSNEKILVNNASLSNKNSKDQILKEFVEQLLHSKMPGQIYSYRQVQIEFIVDALMQSVSTNDLDTREVKKLANSLSFPKK